MNAKTLILQGTKKRITLLGTFLVFLFLASPVQAGEVYDRVMESGKLRCGYFNIPPEFSRDPNTGEFSGIAYDIMAAIGEALHIEIEWVEEAPMGSFIQALKAGRYDAVCSTVWIRADLTREADFSRPVMYTPVGTFVRDDETRFESGRKSIDTPDVKIATIDGESSAILAQFHFPKAQVLSLPELSDVSLLLESVASGKADVAFTYMANFIRYDENNPGKLKAIHTDRPIRAYGNGILIPQGEYQLKRMLDTAIEERLNSGQIDAIIDKHQPRPGAYPKVRRPFTGE